MDKLLEAIELWDRERDKYLKTYKSENLDELIPPTLTVEDAVKILNRVQRMRDLETGHMVADTVLLILISDERVTRAWSVIDKCFA